MIELRKTTLDDLEALFKIQANKASNHMAAFTSKDPYDKQAYLKQWTATVKNPEVELQTIRKHNVIVGSISSFFIEQELNVSYGIDKELWGKGIASMSLSKFIEQFPDKNFFARVAFDNIGSQKVLEKNHFKKVGIDKFFANARGKEIDEFIYQLERPVGNTV